MAFFSKWFKRRPKPSLELVERVGPQVKTYDDVLKDRRDAYAVFLEQHTITTNSPVVRDWAARMSLKYGERVKVWHNVLDWVSALYVVRWGEAVEHWPQTLTEKDIRRALEWEQGQIPAGVRYLPKEVKP